jgi:hypothetical protein
MATVKRVTLRRSIHDSAMIASSFPLALASGITIKQAHEWLN